MTGQLLEIERLVDAPRELVFDAWTNPERLAHWWGPAGMKIRVEKLDLKPGGVFHYAMLLPGGAEMWGIFTYREIVAPEKLVFVNSFSDAEGGVTRHPMAPTWPLKVLNEATFEAQGEGTLFRLRGGPIDASPEELATFVAGISSMQAGFGGTFAQLDAYLKEQK